MDIPLNTYQHFADITDTHAMQTIIPYPLCITRGKGYEVFDSAGKRYIDMLSAVAVCNFGHGHPRLLQALQEQAETISMVPRYYYNDVLSELLETICKSTNMDRAMPMNSGAEAVETAIKAARKWAYSVKGVEKGKAEILVCDDNFHGRTISTVSMSGVAHYKESFRPLTPGFVLLPYNDVEAIEAAITPSTAALIVEPIQGEAGVILPESGYLRACQALCRKNNVLFICDEIQTGMGRTGALLACNHEDIIPDGLIMGKALGGGMLPISLFLAKGSLATVFQPGDHGSTFGGNPLAARVALEALRVLKDEKLYENACELGKYFLQELQGLPAATTVRGKGLMIAIVLDAKYSSLREEIIRLAAAGLLVIPGRNNTIRLLPPLIVDKPCIDETLSLLYTAYSLRSI